MSNIQIRIDKKEKEDAREILDKMGLDMSTAIKLFLRQITLRKALPFLLTSENGLTLEEENRILKASEDARSGKNIDGPFEGDEAIKYLKSL